MNNTAIKTRFGLILQGLVAKSLKHSGFTFRENWQYNLQRERPDFTIPDSDSPKYILEVHQTDSRESFIMKSHRLLTAICEAKTYFGESTISVNILFGDPDTELPKRNLKSLCALFDVNILPRNHATLGKHVEVLEGKALNLAADNKVDVAVAIAKLGKAQECIALSNLLKEELDKGKANPKLEQFWKYEIAREKTQKHEVLAIQSTHYKKEIIESLFISDKELSELVQSKNLNKVSQDTKKHLVAIGLATENPKIGGSRLTVSANLLNFINSENLHKARNLCKIILDEDSSMYYFFEDIRDLSRACNMSLEFVKLARGNEKIFLSALQENLSSGNYKLIKHTRCWLADFMPLVVNESHNAFNRRMLQKSDYNITLANPFSNLVIRSPRLCSNRKIINMCAEIALECFFNAVDDYKIDLNKLNAEELSKKLITFRIDAAIKLQKLNPLYLYIISTAHKLGLNVEYGGVQSLLTDLSKPSDRVGIFDVLKITDGKVTVYVNALYVGEGYGSDHKSDEWSARRRLLGYRVVNGEITMLEKTIFILCLDGIWSEKSINKLYTAGWSYICNLFQFNDALIEVFNLIKEPLIAAESNGKYE